MSLVISTGQAGSQYFFYDLSAVNSRRRQLSDNDAGGAKTGHCQALIIRLVQTQNHAPKGGAPLPGTEKRRLRWASARIIHLNSDEFAFT